MPQTHNKSNVLQYTQATLFFKVKFVHEIIGMLHLSMYICAKMISHVTVYDLDDLMHSNGYNFNSWFLSEGNR